ncbi:NAD-dependent epimerase/dehydratase family protein [Actinomadura atramentaria]|uniref:NAD-dependent epimerase/dehydratase family protein n=1 Tax=Actinomadura atramentaria TaxID=1990 RepID=UPI0003684078|nr:SDR family oxidoreductase [Actinomadura atramentaria]
MGDGARSVLVTGATGLVGFEVADRLRGRPGVAVTATSRRPGTAPPDAVPWTIGGEPRPARLDRHWDVIVHTAADVRWTMTPEQAHRANVATVAALRPLISADTHLVHVSTAYAGGLRGDVSSDDPADYRNTYEWSKAGAERLVRELPGPVTVVRPPLIVGRRADGRAARFAGMYTILRGIAAGSVPVLAAEPDALVDVVPVDDLGDLLVETALRPPDGGTAPVVLAGGDRAPSVRAAVEAMLDGLNAWRAERGIERLVAPRVVPPESWHRFFLPFAREHLTARQNRMIDLLRVFEPYFSLTGPLVPTRRVTGVEDCVRASAAYWADRNPRLASLRPRPWRGAD